MTLLSLLIENSMSRVRQLQVSTVPDHKHSETSLLEETNFLLQRVEFLFARVLEFEYSILHGLVCESLLGTEMIAKAMHCTFQR